MARPNNVEEDKVHRSPPNQEGRDPEKDNAFPNQEDDPNKVMHPNKLAHGPATFIRGLAEAGLQLRGSVVVQADACRVTWTQVTPEMWVATMQQNADLEASVTVDEFHKRVKRAVKSGLGHIRMRLYKPCDASFPPAKVKHHLTKLGVKNLEITVR